MNVEKIRPPDSSIYTSNTHPKPSDHSVSPAVIASLFLPPSVSWIGSEAAMSDKKFSTSPATASYPEGIPPPGYPTQAPPPQYAEAAGPVKTQQREDNGFIERRLATVCCRWLCVTCCSWGGVLDSCEKEEEIYVRFNLWVFLITLNPNQDLLLCKKLKIMHSGTYFPSSKAPGLDLSCWLLNPSKSLQSFSLAILDRVSSLQWSRQFSEWLQALETQPFYSSLNPRAVEIWLSIDS